MDWFDYGAAPVEVRASIGAAHRRAWRRLAVAGTWLTGVERIAVAAEARHVASCALCRRRKEALSPHRIDGDHDPLGQLPEPIVEAIHRIVSDPGRLTRSWFDGLIDDGLQETTYVEVVGVLLTVVSVDTFARGLGIPMPDLPAPVAGEPLRLRPSAARPDTHWVATIAPDDAGAGESDLYAGTNGANIYRALSLVPDEARGFRDLDDNLYLSYAEMVDFATETRAIGHAQIELVAGRVSALNQCLY